MMEISYHCPKCKEEVTLEKRAHLCLGVRRVRGQVAHAVTYYNPVATKPNKQSTQPGYMKKFGSRPAKYVFALENVSGNAFAVVDA